jgi:hypothetical protein
MNIPEKLDLFNRMYYAVHAEEIETELKAEFENVEKNLIADYESDVDQARRLVG